MRSTRMLLLVMATSCLLPILAAKPLAAQKQKGLRRFAVDMVTLKSGERLRGALLGPGADGQISMAVQREWLKATRREFYAKHVKDETASARQSLDTLLMRIEEWQNEEPASNLLNAFLEGERDRLQRVRKSLDEGELETQFVVLRFPRTRVDFWFTQPPENRQVAAVAWQEELKDVERREVRDLLKELNNDGIDPAEESVELGSRLPPHSQSDREWTARRAIIEYHFGKKVDFQGMGSSLFRTGNGQPQVNVAQLLPELLQSQVTSQLGDLLNDPALGLNPPRRKKPAQVDYSKAIATAAREGAGSFRVTQLKLDLQRRRATVSGQFFARMPDGRWEPVWAKSLIEDASKPRPDLEERIRKDPQIRQALDALKSIGGGLDAQLNIAMRFGAATMESQQKIDGEFSRFRSRYLRRLDSPPLEWANAAKAKN